ncbi:MAG: hypothetical protein ACXVZ3_10490 [Gaiellaceae bacterium]
MAGWVIVVVYVLAVAAGTSLLARRKSRSPAWWFAGGLAGGLPALILAALATPAGEPWRFRAPLVLALFALFFVGAAVILVEISQAT